MESDRELVADIGSKKLRNIAKTLSPFITWILESGCQESLSRESLEEIKSILVMVNSLPRDNRKWFNPIQEIKILKKLEKDVRGSIHYELPVVIASAQLNRLSQLPNVPDTRNMVNVQVSPTSEIEEISNQGRSICSPLEIERLLQHERSLFVPCRVESSLQAEILYSPLDMSTIFLGFGEHVVNVKNILLHDGVNVLVVTGMGGTGKSTLAAAICRDSEIREYFEERVLYFTISECPDLPSILETMWRHIIGSPVPHFTNVEEQQRFLRWQIKSRNQPVLVVLDDICRMNHLEKLIFEGATDKTLVTTRDKNFILKMLFYELPLLQQEHALSLFCHCAFVKPTIPKSCNKELVIKVQQKCSGLPLAFKVISSSLHGKSVSVWEGADKMFSAGIPDENIIHKILDTSIDVLSEIKKQCFLDRGAIPQGKVIPAKAL